MSDSLTEVYSCCKNDLMNYSMFLLSCLQSGNGRIFFSLF